MFTSSLDIQYRVVVEVVAVDRCRDKDMEVVIVSDRSISARSDQTLEYVRDRQESIRGFCHRRACSSFLPFLSFSFLFISLSISSFISVSFLPFLS